MTRFSRCDNFKIDVSLFLKFDEESELFVGCESVSRATHWGCEMLEWRRGHELRNVF